MKKILFSVLFTILIANNTKSQNKSMLSMQFSYNELGIAYQYRIFSSKLWAEIYTGIANQDINKDFDDYTSNLKFGYNLLSNKNNQIALTSGFGVYIPNNKYYNALTPMINIGSRYSRLLGNSKKHNLFINTGYQYGKRDYIQEYSSEILSISTIETFKISSFYVSLGYGYSF